MPAGIKIGLVTAQRGKAEAREAASGRADPSLPRGMTHLAGSHRPLACPLAQHGNPACHPACPACPEGLAPRESVVEGKPSGGRTKRHSVSSRGARAAGEGNGNLLLLHHKVLYINSLSIPLPCRSPHSARRSDSDIDGVSKMFVDRLSNSSALENRSLSPSGGVAIGARYASDSSYCVVDTQARCVECEHLLL